MIEEGTLKETPKSIQTELAYVMTYSISLFPKRLEARRALHPALMSPRKECRDLKEWASWRHAPQSMTIIALSARKPRGPLGAWGVPNQRYGAIYPRAESEEP